MAIKKAKELFSDLDLPSQLAVIKSHFKSLVASITALEERLLLVESLHLLEGVQSQLTMVPFKTNLLDILNKNPDFNAMKNISSILKGDSKELHGMDSNLPYKFRWAPITSVDCERTFSKLKTVLADNRTNLTECHVCDILLIQWIKDLLKCSLFAGFFFAFLTLFCTVFCTLGLVFLQLLVSKRLRCFAFLLLPTDNSTFYCYRLHSLFLHCYIFRCYI